MLLSNYDIFTLLSNTYIESSFMAKSNAQRQREYRKNRQLAGENGQRQMNTWIATNAKLNLERLSICYGVTERDLLEKLIAQEFNRCASTLNDIEFQKLLDKEPFVVTE